jgi:AraC-like DNA-binding protein
VQSCATKGQSRDRLDRPILDPRVSITLNIIEERQASVQLNLADTCRTLGLSEAHMLRLFHREVGKTLRQHLRDVRMTRAAELVKHDAQPIKLIAFNCGYSDICNFYRDFKTVHGMTPRIMRLRELAACAALKPTVDSRAGRSTLPEKADRASDCA